eukprot:CAMPEP_0202688198 /NCGR_PEP_ID=MMETSP1385-20130828/3726_1 /ASSEMBLY_ACC=CAM_ASM_000861 /TAXON_ID=933848 /ORGANISM="Elphidium margaritaceum" /LENGTH=91 /DNA_ID=CAMNT_0049343107 /DNA_START=66 /DNA_END=341 /DNA_ORIENTATION=+
MENKTVTVELKNNLLLRGELVAVDQYLNIKLNDVEVVEKDKYPQLLSVKRCFIRGSVVRYVMMAKSDIDTELLQDSCRRENKKEETGTKTQ